MTDKEKTISYYDSHAKEFAASANATDLGRDYAHFLKYVPAGGTIADMGCGSGRDLRFFRQSGYDASGVDASSAMCAFAREYSGCPVLCCDALSWKPGSKLDAIWANGSLLHLYKDEIIGFLKKKSEYLKPGGVLYFSMKAGIPEGFDEKGRYFTPFSEDIVDAATADGSLEVLERWAESDSLGRKGYHWEAVILRRCPCKQ